jgi:diadenosine tetraphosphate (Ap4A) HIT family hydrolase
VAAQQPAIDGDRLGAESGAFLDPCRAVVGHQDRARFWVDPFPFDQLRIHADRYTDAYLQCADVQRGYTLVIWRGRHVNEPTELDEAEAAGYWAEVLAVARALISNYAPLKMNYETLGNSVPHLHTHLVPRYTDDPRPGEPFPLTARQPDARCRKLGFGERQRSCGNCSTTSSHPGL